jgi:hypothetical protein
MSSPRPPSLYIFDFIFNPIFGGATQFYVPIYFRRAVRRPLETLVSHLLIYISLSFAMHYTTHINNNN